MTHVFCKDSSISSDSKYIGIPLNSSDITDSQNIKYSYKNNQIDVIICESIDGRKITKNIIKNVKNTIQTVIDFFKITNEKVHIILVLNKKKKTLPTENKLDMQNVNNGVTIFYMNHSDNKFIYIYRYEDMYKVLIHELVHYFKKDLHHTIEGNHDILKRYNIIDSTGSFNLTEAYTETIACYIYYFYYKNLKNDKLKIAFFKKKLLRIAKGQVEYCKKFQHVTQYSHMFSYYICRGLLFSDVEKFYILYKKKDLDGLLKLIDKNYTKLDKVTPLFQMHL